MEPADVSTVVAIDRLCFPTPWSASSYLYELSHSGRSFYYVLEPAQNENPPTHGGWRGWLRGLLGVPGNRRVMGYMGFRNARPHPEAHISTIAVHPDWRGRGLGELLLLTAIEKIIRMRFSVITLEVRASNSAAQNLYRKYGFRYQGVHRGYYRDGEDALLMSNTVDRPSYPARLAALRHTLQARIQRLGHEIGQNGTDTL